MTNDLIVLIIEAMVIYLLVLWTHSLRRRFGLAHFYALLGGLTAIMSWVTDAGTEVSACGITFMVGSTVFYTSLLLGIFVIYVFDGPHATRIAISTVAGVSILVPIVALVLHLQMKLTGQGTISYVPIPSLRINTASVVTTVADLVFLAIVWECLGKPKLHVGLGLRAFATLLGVMWLDVILFGTGAFVGTPDYVKIIQGTLISRLAIATFAWPFLYAYLDWQNRKAGNKIKNRPVLAILKEVAKVRAELGSARQEIERRKEAEQALRVALAKYTALFESFPLGIVVYDSDGRALEANAVSEELLGLSRGTTLPGASAGSGWHVVRPDGTPMPPEEFAGVRALKESRIIEDVEMGIVKDDRMVWISMTAAPLPLVGDGVVVTCYDITERRILEKDLLQRQKLESIGLFAGGLAHDLNNINQAILGNAELVAEMLPQETETRSLLTEITSQVSRATTICNQLLTFAGHGNHSMGAVDLNSLVQQTIKHLRAPTRTGIVLETQLTPDLPAVCGDTSQLEQVLVVLVTNAIEAYGEGTGTVRIKTWCDVPDPEMFIQPWTSGSTLTGEYIHLQVADDGCGMDQTTQERFFEPFYSTKFTGRGLGLATVLGIVKTHRGAISVESTVGEGTEFTIVLPIDTELPSQETVLQAPAADWRGQGTILVIDDERSVRRTTMAILAKIGFSVVTAEDGPEGIELFRDHVSDVVCVILDLTMPKMNGREVFDRIREIRPEVPVVVASGYDAETSRAQFFPGEIAVFLHKPYSPTRLRAEIYGILNSSASERGAS